MCKFKIIGAIFLIFVSLFIFPFSAMAPIPIEEKQSEAARAQQEISQLNKEVEIAVEAYNKAGIELEQTTKEIINTRNRLDVLQKDFERQRAIFNNRLKAIYINGDVPIFEILLNTKSFSDFLERVDFLLRISSQDSKLLKKIVQQQEETIRLKKSLEEKKKTQAVTTQRLATQKAEIQDKLSKQKAYLDNLNAEIKALIEEQQKATETTDIVAVRKKFPDLKVDPKGILNTAFQYLGTPYVWGGSSPAGFDCSGFVQYVFAQNGIYLPRTADVQYYCGRSVSSSDLQAGDLVFFGPPVHHVGIYVANGSFIHAPYTGEVVKIQPLSSMGDYYGAKRVID